MFFQRIPHAAVRDVASGGQRLGRGRQHGFGCGGRQRRTEVISYQRLAETAHHLHGINVGMYSGLGFDGPLQISRHNVRRCNAAACRVSQLDARCMAIGGYWRGHSHHD